MKCRHCGASVTLQDEYCPYCGALNEPARKHIADMKRYHSDFQQTKQEVMDHVAKQSRSHGQLAVIGILVVVNLIALVFQMNIYNFTEWYQDIRNRIHASQHYAVLEAYEAEGNYELLSAYYSRNYLYGVESLREFDTVTDMASDLSRIREAMFYLNREGESYSGKGEFIQRIANFVAYFYDSLSRQDQTYHPERYAQPHLDAMLDMEQELRLLLKAECALTDEDLSQLSQMDSQSILILIGRRTGSYE